MIRVEFYVLCENHPNVIKLYAWSYEVGDFHRQLIPVMELACTDYATFVQAFDNSV